MTPFVLTKLAALPGPLTGRYVAVSTALDGSTAVYTVGLRMGGIVDYRARSIPADGNRLRESTDVALVRFDGAPLAVGLHKRAYDLDERHEAPVVVDLAGVGRAPSPWSAVHPVTGALHLLATDRALAAVHVVIPSGGFTRRVTPIEQATALRGLALTVDHVVVLTEGRLGISDGSIDGHWRWLPTPPGDFTVRNAFDDDDGSVVVDVLGPRTERWTIALEQLAIRTEARDPSPKQVDLEHVGNPDGIVFVTDPLRPASHNDDGHGWLVGLAHTTDRTTFIVADALRPNAPLVAELALPDRIRPGVRAIWVPDN